MSGRATALPTRWVFAWLLALLPSFATGADPGSASSADTGAPPSATAVANPVAHPPRLVRVELPRDSARHLGEVVEYRALVEWPSGWEIDRDGLPARTRDDLPIELRDHRVDAAGDLCRDCRWLSLQWQIFRAVRAAEDLKLPATTVRLRRDVDIATLALPPAVLSVFPLVPWESRRDWLDSLRPGWQALPMDVGSRLRDAILAVGVAALSLAAWAWSAGLGWRPSASRPFARAWRAMRARRRESPLAPADAQDLQWWHEAFHLTAGEAVLADDLPRFLQRHPAFAPHGQACQAVFEASRRRFFLDDRGGAPMPSAQALTSLASEMARAEFAAARSARPAGPRRPPAGAS